MVRLRNLDTIRLLAASSVIFSHSFLIGQGSEDNEPIARLTGHIAGIYGVFVFLIISGLLVSQSVERSSSVGRFLWKRFLRIYPAFLVNTLICAFVIAPFFSYYGLFDFLHSLQPFKYTAHLMALDVEYMMWSVRFYTDAADNGIWVNGSLWTIVQEILCYVIVAALFALSFFNIKVAVAMFVAGTAWFGYVNFGEYWPHYLRIIPTWLGYLNLNLDLEQGILVDMAWSIPAFASGAIAYFISKRWTVPGWLALCCVGVLIIVTRMGLLEMLFSLPAAIIVLWVTSSGRINLGNGSKFGDLSYGTYLYGWPIQQTLRGVFGPMDPYLMVAIALPLALLAGYLSWHLVEKHALRLKDLPEPALLGQLRRTVVFWRGHPEVSQAKRDK